MSGELFIPDDFTSIYATNNNFNKLAFESTSSHLVDLYIEANNFSNEDFNTITSLGRLKNLYLTGNNRIDIIPSKINLLKELKVLDVSFTDIKQVPSTLFELSNLSTLNLSDCPQLKAKIINFNNKINYCNFYNTNLVCYQENTCEYLEAKNFPACTENDIQEIKADQEIQNEIIEKELKTSQNNNKKKGLRDGTKFLIITAIALVFMIIISFAIFFALRKHFFKIYTNKEADIVIAPDIIRTPSESTNRTSLTSPPNIYTSPNFNKINLDRPTSITPSVASTFSNQNNINLGSVEDISLISSSSSLPVSVDPTVSKSINCDVLYNENRKTSIGHNTEPFMSDKLKKFIEEDRKDKSSSESHNQNNPDSNPPPYSEI